MCHTQIFANGTEVHAMKARSGQLCNKGWPWLHADWTVKRRTVPLPLDQLKALHVLPDLLRVNILLLPTCIGNDKL